MNLRRVIETAHWKHEQPASALGIRLDRVADTGTSHGLILLQGCEPWGEEHVLASQRLGPCPICRGARLARKRYCLCDDRCGLDGKVAYPGERPDSRLNPGWTATPTVAEGAKRPGLKGGLGDRVGKRGRATESERVPA